MRVLLLSSLLAAVAAPLACAFTIAVTEINWTFTAKDPATFKLETDLGQIHTLLPTLPALGGYALHAVNAENVDFILAASPPFAITA
ncbi:hypothetical protein B0H13DRAFT_1960315 [Mycena leptocephala]|nr:hypothetical protein B0H13DRAFT_1960315 [Mycena leptocephala]